MEELVGRLGALGLFADVPAPRLEAISHRHEEAMFPRGAVVLRKGLSGSNLYVILEGEVRVDVPEPVRLGRGDFFGEVSALLGAPPTADIVAESDLRCLVVPGAGLRDFLLENPEVAYRMLTQEAARLAQALSWLG